MLFCFDFDLTMTNIHFHNYCVDVLNMPFGKVSGEEPPLQDLFKKDDGTYFFKNKAQLYKVLHDILAHPDHQIAITSYTGYASAMPQALRALGLSEAEVEKIRIEGGFPTGSQSVVGKNEHIQKAMQHFHISDPMQVALIDDSYDNISIA